MPGVAKKERDYRKAPDPSTRELECARLEQRVFRHLARRFGAWERASEIAYEIGLTLTLKEKQRLRGAIERLRLRGAIERAPATGPDTAGMTNGRTRWMYRLAAGKRARR